MFSGLLTRLARYRRNAATVLTMNRRNLHYIYPNNPHAQLEVADNKLETKLMLQGAAIPHARTYFAYHNFLDLNTLEQNLALLDAFAVKPAHGSGGSGIKLITGRHPDGSWRSINGERIMLADIRKHISDILFGVYASDLNDIAIIEEIISQHDEMSLLSPYGLADIRMIMHQDQPVMSMSRIPTRRSGGRANLHQGAVGVGIDIPTGMTRNVTWFGKMITHHPDSGVQLVDLQIPQWPQILDICYRTARACPLKYLGLDVAVSSHGPMIIEINARPGLTIQNANLRGMRSILERQPS
ncbi:MAG: hypothetical protein HY940_08175 [Gammaproteobacteria bacterium]|nr:hypothetical protein [Gammaproteobacteria bacterium]